MFFLFLETKKRLIQLKYLKKSRKKDINRDSGIRDKNIKRKANRFYIHTVEKFIKKFRRGDFFSEI
ncbi:hypothetical protein C2G38_2075373 [Gigaspora rosea]|uniref:Uncharacterized protein n=1 Tax=Gigaspora rosea TaxID=44941 RepID=A0A397VRF3_9GLOM|nr:hypothetical protein C2G38_2075373 [Gigaspora rosea]